MRFSLDELDSIMLDIEGLELPDHHNYPVLKLVLEFIEDYADVRGEDVIQMTYGRAAGPEDMPEFLKAQAARDEDEKPTEVENRQPRTSVAPQAAFSPAPVPDAVGTDPQATPAPAAAEDPTPAPELDSPKASHGIRWTEEEEDVLIKGRLAGAPFKELARALGRKEPTCASKMFWLTQNRPARIARIKAGIRPAPAKQPAYYTGPWSSEDEAYLVKQRDKGVAFKMIALKLNRPMNGVTQKFYNLRDAADEAAPTPKPVEKFEAAPATTPKAMGGKGILPRPCPDEHWSIEDDLDLVSEHHRGLSMLDVSIMLERTKPDCVARYNALMDAMPAGPFTERQIILKQTLAHHASLAREAA